VETPKPSEPSDNSPIFFRQWIALEQRSTPLRRGVIYARYSTVAQDTSESIEVQISECRKYAAQHEIILAREPFVDRAETGTSTQNRRSYQELLALAKSSQRDFEVILTFHTSRWGRGVESEIDEYALGNHGIKIIAVSQPFTAEDGIESTFMKGVLRKIDAYYSMQASKYTHAYQTSNAQHDLRTAALHRTVSPSSRSQPGKATNMAWRRPRHACSLISSRASLT
jgi:hypothetical protein